MFNIRKKESEWIGIKDACCVDTNIITAPKSKYGQCCVCFRVFTRVV